MPELKQVQMSKNFRQFLPPEYQNITCPNPSDEVMKRQKDDQKQQRAKYKKKNTPPHQSDEQEEGNHQQEEENEEVYYLQQVDYQQQEDDGVIQSVLRSRSQVELDGTTTNRQCIDCSTTNQLTRMF
jgi:hypothetical protein